MMACATGGVYSHRERSMRKSCRVRYAKERGHNILLFCLQMTDLSIALDNSRLFPRAKLNKVNSLILGKSGSRSYILGFLELSNPQHVTNMRLQRDSKLSCYLERVRATRTHLPDCRTEAVWFSIAVGVCNDEWDLCTVGVLTLHSDSKQQSWQFPLRKHLHYHRHLYKFFKICCVVADFLLVHFVFSLVFLEKCNDSSDMTEITTDKDKDKKPEVF